MSNIIAICGPTCVEKTNIARELSRRCGYKVKHPGEAAKTRAKVGKLHSVAEVPEDVHRAIDEETRELARTTPMTTIIESGFADCVIGDLENVFVVRLTAGDEVRQQRFDHRKEEGGGRTRQLGDNVADQDSTDAELRKRLYGDLRADVHLEIDTTSRNVDDCVSEIWERFAAAMGDEDFSGPQYASSPYKFGNLGKEDAKDAG
jgi:cytidylate kinase